MTRPGYEWIEGWGKLPESEPIRTAWPHAGMAVTAAGEVVTFHPTESRLVFFDRNGNLVRISGLVEMEEAHGITLMQEGDQEFLWLADAAMKKAPGAGYVSPGQDEISAVIKVSMEGQLVLRLPRPDPDLYREGQYRPTCVAVDEQRLGGSGDVWVGDGYGSSYVHRYSAEGTYLGSLTGMKGAGRFQGPHAVFVDRRGSEAELYVADRRNGRIQVYDLEGRFKRVVGEGFLSTPTWFVTDGDLLLIAEFNPPKLTILDSRDRPVGQLFEDLDAPARSGWPNELNAKGNPIRTSTLRAGRLNSPHALAIDKQGSLYVTEWLIGGRISKLVKTGG